MALCGTSRFIAQIFFAVIPSRIMRVIVVVARVAAHARYPASKIVPVASHAMSFATSFTGLAVHFGVAPSGGM